MPDLTGGHADILKALAEVIVPRAFEEDGWPALHALIERRAAALPASQREDLRMAFTVLANAVARLALGGTLVPWHKLPPDRRAECFARWGRSSLAPVRHLHEGLRRLVLSAWYGGSGGRADIGALAPLSQRAPQFPWEGPLPGAPDASGVIARGPRDRPLERLAGSWPRAHPGITVGRDLRGEYRFHADAIVVGSGAGGSLVAARLAAAGLEVLVLEAGPWLEASEFTEEEGTLLPRLMADGGNRMTTDRSMTLLQGANVGGGTTVNWMLMLRPRDYVLDDWVRRFGLSDLSPTRLAPTFDRIERELSAAAVPDEAHSPVNRLLLDGAQQLGWHATAASINARGCVRAGTCSLGCRYGAKQGAGRVYLPLAFAHGARLLADTRVEAVRVLDGQRAHPLPRKQVRASTIDPVTGAVVGTVIAEAPLVVLAAGAVETPALLLRSGMGGGPVGHWLRLHPTAAVLGRYDRDIHASSGLPQSALVDEFLDADGRGYGWWIEGPALGPVLAAVSLPGVGAVHRERMLAMRQTAPFIALTRDGADLDHSSGRVQVDRRGVARVSYRVAAADRRHVQAAIVSAARLHFANGATEVTTLHRHPQVLRSRADLEALARVPAGSGDVALFSAHVNGSCRMGSSSRDAAVTPEGERYGVRGLFIADGSLLPTAPGVNPQETILAVASHVADAILARRS